jgi:hypothetical protein
MYGTHFLPLHQFNIHLNQLRYPEGGASAFFQNLGTTLITWHKNSWISQFHDPSIPPYLITPWSRVLLEKLTGLQLVKKFLTFYGTRRFITTLTSACHLSLS